MTDDHGLNDLSDAELLRHSRRSSAASGSSMTDTSSA